MMINIEIKVLLIALIIFIFVLIRYVSSTSNLNSNNEVTKLPGNQSKFAKKDCSVQTVYSTNDTQCSLICQSPNVYISKNGICVNALVNTSSVIENKCSPENGVLAYVVGDPQFGKSSILCLSIDIGIQPNDPTKSNIMCKNGSIDINYVKSFPEINNCKCAKDDFPAIIHASSTIRKHITCTNKSLEILFS